MKNGLNPQEYFARSDEGSWVASLKADLREAPEESRAEFLSQVLVLREKAGLTIRGWLDFAAALLEDRRSYERLLRDGLTVADASTIRHWLKCCVQRIGMRRTVNVLQEEDKKIPQRVDLTIYWLPRLARTPKEQAIVTAFLATRAPRH
jgi:hypothetical protein